jgi:protein arginine N-methyltransferase 5
MQNDKWATLVLLINYEIALELTPQLPQDERLLKMWLAEPVVLVIVPAGVFVPNKNGHPVLTKPIQNVLKMLMHKAWCVYVDLM